MELFYSTDIDAGFCRLDQDESAHCVKVLRHRAGDEIFVIDGEGTLLRCTLVDDSPKGAAARIEETTRDWGSHPYRLTMAVCPTKNMDRYEWFAEKATEMGVDVIAPVIGDHSERKVVKTERLQRVLLSAAKQSLKGAVPHIMEPCSVSQFIRSAKDSSALKLICYCFEEGDTMRAGIKDVLADNKEVIVLVGPEGDFSREEVQLAFECGFRPVHLGESRLRTETAAVFATAAAYYHFMK